MFVGRVGRDRSLSVWPSQRTHARRSRGDLLKPALATRGTVELRPEGSKPPLCGLEPPFRGGFHAWVLHQEAHTGLRLASPDRSTSRLRVEALLSRTLKERMNSESGPDAL